MNYIKDVQLKNGNEYNMVIEIKKWSKDKFELKEPNFDSLESVRRLKVRYPFYYGCFPQTLAGDGDAADAILLTTKKHKLLDIVKVQPIALIKTIDKGEEDNKIICIEGEIKHLDKIENIVLKFLSIYKGKKADMILDKNIYGPSEAVKAIELAHKNFKPKTNPNSLKVD